MEFEPIGVIHTPFQTKEECPMQPMYALGAVGKVEVFEPYASGLRDVELFSHVYLLYHFDRSGEVKMFRPPFLDDLPHGVFATRHPCRPNGIGMSIVQVLKRENNVVEVAGIDVLDGTPLLDIKPYMPRFDKIDDASEGWLSEKPPRPKPAGRE
ncbi:tRNA (N6-threonylcarbamoyladenosine(37)-N6)-methyltransferase TrmO [Geomonas sp. RF6]|uniref:tRNA (N6-threonylcarbamoyladenosine(37)-N6)-methyltransferase TrmO n=1 Tax=Geomonas sp. RF6 TaxID=2897342 RepID=UPI001E43A4BE|nr:tRNA (N6-threonylcarbamoyladenosine(37)-N6)-methyltransferase TrmO [Geomonas sp. RF6]UFS71511.1 tRNA (N6-threonylcarbamoyladenosine(37)-N6)-methyltransferase TrmO [Geomonas sp. RF6]